MIQKTINDYMILEIPYNSKEYPQKLKQIKNPPKVLYALGNITLLSKPIVAIVGTRKVSDLGAIKTKKIVEHFIKKGYVIASGLALGVDEIAMRTALNYNAKVIAVLPSIDNIVPKSNKPLADEIVERDGLLISEYKDAIRKYMFIQRNRIVSAISDIVVVVETDIKGGTMHTVRFAKEQGKKILVANIPAPGNIKLMEEGYEVL
ncbi:MAG: DNA processing protein DprA [Archaeoglobales archaeon]|nr:MAG: DNA processing protein DprA [Archaeoglobales archaeon]